MKYMIVWLLGAQDRKKKGVQSSRSTCRWPPLCDLTTAKFSPITNALQYLSACYGGVHDVCDALARYNHSSDDETLFRDATLCGSSWLWVKTKQLRSLLAGLAAAADTRLSTNERLAVGQRVHKLKGCCSEAACTRKIKKLVPSPADIFKDDVQAICLGIANSAVHTADVECAHNRNQQNSTVQSSWGSLCAQYVNCHACAIGKRETASREEKATCLSNFGDSSAVGVIEPATSNRQAFGTSPLTLFHSQCLRADRLMGLTVNPAL